MQNNPSLLWFFHEPSLVTSITPSIAPLVISIAPSLAQWSIASAIHRSYDCSVLHRMHHPSLYLKFPDPSTVCIIHRLILLLPDPSNDQFFTDPSTIQPFIVWSIACSHLLRSPWLHSRVIDSLLLDQSLLGFLHDPSLDTSITPSVAPRLNACNNPSRLQFNVCAIHRSLDWSLIHRCLHIHRMHYPSLLLLIKDSKYAPSI